MTTRVDTTSRPSEGDRDLDAMYDMVADSPEDALHLADLPWRLCSPPAREPERTRLWEAADGTMLAWAVLQFPWHCLDYQIRLDARSEEMEASVLDWATERLAVEVAARGEPLPFYVSAREGDSMRVAAIRGAGFTADGWSYVHMARDLGGPIPEPVPPDGFRIRALAGPGEVEAYVATHRAAFGSTNMTSDWRRSTLRHPHYAPALDLVAEAPDGALVGFCVCWITPPLAAYQRRGIGRALLLEAFRRAMEMGAQRIEVDAESYNEASRDAYASVGFRPAFEAPFFLRSVG